MAIEVQGLGHGTIQRATVDGEMLMSVSANDPLLSRRCRHNFSDVLPVEGVTPLEWGFRATFGCQSASSVL